MGIQENLRQVIARVSEAAERSGRDPRSIRIVGVTKTVERDAVDAAYEAGLRDFGENRVQDARRKFAGPLPADSVLHLIGHLQTNKVRDAVNLFSVIHSVDRPGLIEALQRRAGAVGKTLDILIQVNVAGEEQKHGCSAADALALARLAIEQPNLRLRGLMTIAPLAERAEDVRWVFRELRQLRDQLATALPGTDLSELSMGMTNDFEVAIEEGATMVRVGRALFS